MAKSNQNKAPIPADQFGKLPPQAVELEEAVLGALMVEAGCYERISTLIKPECFYKVAHQHIYEAISDLAKRNEPTDMMMVTEQLRKAGKLDDVGGPYFITILTAKVSSGAHVEFHSRIIHQRFISRELIRIASEIQSRAYNDETDVDDLLQDSNIMLDSVMNNVYNVGSLRPIGDVLDDVEEAYKHRIELTTQGKTTGVNTGLFELNKLLGGGWQKSTLNIIAARPAMGKTALLLAFAKAAAGAGVPVCIYSLEMSDISLVNRLIISEAYQNEDQQIKPDRFRQGYCNEREWALFEAAKRRLQDLPIYIDDKPLVDAQYIRTHSKLMKKRGKCGIVLIDYLQLTDMTDGNKTRNREQEVSQTTRQFKILSKEIDSPIVLLSQLNRGVEARNDKKPLLSDLRESGAIEQDADTVSFIYRPAYYKILETDDGKSTENLGYIILAKQRDGAVGEVPFTHNTSLTRIWDYYEDGGMPEGVGPNSYSDDDDVPF